METKQAKPETKPKPRPRIRRAIVNLLVAVDKSIAAADEARAARKEFLKLAESQAVEVLQ